MSGVTRRQFVERTLGAAALTAALPRDLLAQAYPSTFVLLIGGLCYHDSDEDDDYRVWMPKRDESHPHHAVLITTKPVDKMAKGHPGNDVGDDLVSYPLDGLEVTATASSATSRTQCNPDKKELTVSYQLPYPTNASLMGSWSSLDWFVPCRKFFNNKLKGKAQRKKNSEALLHVASGDIRAIWPVGEETSGTHQVKLWEISVGGKFKGLRAIPNWAVALLPGNECTLTVNELHDPTKVLDPITLTGAAAIAFLPADGGTSRSNAGEDPTKHFKLFDPILKPHKEVTIVHRGATFPLQRRFEPRSVEEKVSHFLDRVEKLVTFKVKTRGSEGSIGIMTAGSTACPPTHDP